MLIDITDLSDTDLDTLLGVEADPIADLLALLDSPMSDTPAPVVVAPTLTVGCPRCNATGRYVRGWDDLGPCFRCNGSGQVKNGTAHLRGRRGHSMAAMMAADELRYLE